VTTTTAVTAGTARIAGIAGIAGIGVASAPVPPATVDAGTTTTTVALAVTVTGTGSAKSDTAGPTEAPTGNTIVSADVAATGAAVIADTMSRAAAEAVRLAATRSRVDARPPRPRSARNLPPT
jgi:hypothetical protein